MGKTQKPANGSALNFEAQLWAAAEQAVPAPHYKKAEYNCARPEGLCLGLIFLKYISDAFEEKREQLLLSFSDPLTQRKCGNDDFHAAPQQMNFLNHQKRDITNKTRSNIFGWRGRFTPGLVNQFSFS